MTNLSIQFEYDDMYAEQDALLEEFCENPYDRYVLGEKYNDMWGLDYPEDDDFIDETKLDADEYWN